MTYTTAVGGAGPATQARDGRFLDLLVSLGLVSMIFQVVQFGPAQPAHVWLLLALGLLVFQSAFTTTRVEVLALVAFIAFAVLLTLAAPFDRIKSTEQIVKFAVFYPGFYFVGRWLGGVYTLRPLPLGSAYLFGLIAVEYVVQMLQLPVIHQPVDFAAGALHGTFRERNWLAVYVLMLSYFVFETSAVRQKSEEWRIALFVSVNLVSMFLTQSKTAMVAVGVVLLLRTSQPMWRKVVAVVAGAAVYWWFLGHEFNEENIRVRLEEERGRAFDIALDLIAQSPLGHGFGFVEAYFSTIPVFVRGLGAGVNSVFSVPLDLMIIAGPVGLAFWLFWFVGLGNRTFSILAPIAALSLLNPLHQSEIVYFFLGMLVSNARLKAAIAEAEASAPARRS